MDYFCRICRMSFPGTVPNCKCEEGKTLELIKRKKGSTILEIVVTTSMEGYLFLLEKLQEPSGEIFCMSTCLLRKENLYTIRQVIEEVSIEGFDIHLKIKDDYSRDEFQENERFPLFLEL